ncbi:hypothetical protein Hanom_Chr14g01334711 [Helianthus anomalus]
MDVSENYYDKFGNRSGIIRWGFDHDRRRWWIKRKVGPVDLIILSKSPYVDDKPGGRGYLFFERLQRGEARGFLSMHTAESITSSAKGVRDPRTNKRMKIISWPPTDKEKTIPLAYDETLDQAVIVCGGDVSFRLTDPIYLLNLDQENLEALAMTQIRSAEKYEAVAKGWTTVVAGVLHVRKKGFGGYHDKADGGEGS